MLSNKYNFFLRYCSKLSAGSILKGYNILYFTKSTKQRPFWEVRGSINSVQNLMLHHRVDTVR